MIDFLPSRQASAVRRTSMLPLATSVAIHAGAIILLLALRLSDRIIARPPLRAMVLLTPSPLIHPIAPASLPELREARKTLSAPRQFLAPVVRPAAAPVREPELILELQTPLAEVPRPLLPTAEVAHLAVAPPPPLRIDNLTPLSASAPMPSPSVANDTLRALRSSGFEQIAGEVVTRARVSPLRAGEFADATIIPPDEMHRAPIAPAPAVTRSVEILSKPRPAYSEEARRQRIEGEVLLEILFAASGHVRVLGTVRGLGHGLDESAITAAQAIRFRPAERAGIAADSVAVVHIVFQLAY